MGRLESLSYSLFWLGLVAVALASLLAAAAGPGSSRVLSDQLVLTPTQVDTT